MYEAFFNLSQRPFSLTPDSRFLFPSQGHKRALSYLLYGLEQREGFVVITGDIGTGKTLLIQTLFAELAQRKIATARVAGANLSADSVLPMVAAAFGRPFESLSKVSLLRDLEATLLTDSTYSEGALLVVDEAQTFSKEALEELRILSNFEVGGRALMQVFLVGQTDLRQILMDRDMTQLRQRVIASHHLEPLARDECEEYIWHRLTTAGWKGDPDLTPRLFDSIFAWSKGTPRLVNLLMDRLLLYAYLEEEHRLDAEDAGIVMRELSLESREPETPMQTVSGDGVEVAQLTELEDRVSALEAGFTLVMRHVAKGAASAPKSVESPPKSGDSQ